MSQPLAPYSDYKPAGLPWLDKVPAHWEVVSNRKVFAERKDRGHTGEELLSVTISRGVIRQSDLIKNTSKKDSSNEDKSKYKLVLPGDFAYNKMRMWQGAVGYSDFRGVVSPAYIVLEPIEKIDVRYYHYLMRTPAYVEESHRYSYGICDDQLSLRFEDFRLIKTLLPPLPEQERIVAFLECKARQIDRLLRNKRQLIKLITEQKRALIHRAVTQGLDSNAPRKDSGVEWLGEVPAHWEVKPNRELFKELKQRETSGESLLSVTIGQGILKQNEYLATNTIKKDSSNDDRSKYKLVLPGDFAYNKMRMWQGAAGLSTYRGIVSPAYIVIRPSLGLYGWYYHFLFRTSFYSREAYRFSYGICDDQLSLRYEDFRLIMSPCPPFEEQQAIVNYVNLESERIDQAISRAQREIELIQEYRTRLIADVVTGRVDVRHLSVTAVSNDVSDLLDEETGEEESEEELLLETEDGRE